MLDNKLKRNVYNVLYSGYTPIQASIRSRGHYQPTSKTPLWRFAGGPMVTRFCMLNGILTKLLRIFLRTYSLQNEEKSNVWLQFES